MTRTAAKLELSADERQQLALMRDSPSLPPLVVRRAKILLMAADGYPHVEIARQFGVSPPTVSFWKKRFTEHGLAGLQDRPKSGLPRIGDAEVLAELLSKVLHETPHPFALLRIAAKGRLSSRDR
uniref:helix-turn-helix domain-containing protein n=1 Tax=Cupriavidus taiwanensis TaxID=164546 RepID=UPI003F490F00